MATQTLSVLQPDFYKDFGCVAAACRSNCCNHPWLITVDKACYKKLRRLRKPLWLAQNLSRYVTRNPNSTHIHDYAILNNDNGCVFQTKDGLCRIHGELGAEYLCHTCRVYPRYHCIYRMDKDGGMVLENSLCTSCEEVARILLAKKDPIQFVTTEQQAPAELTSPYFKDVFVQLLPSLRPMLAHYHAIRGVCIAVLQAREHSFEKRLKLLCILLDKLDADERDGQQDNVPQLLEQFVAAAETDLYDPMLQLDTKTDMAKVFANIGSMLAMRWDKAPEFIQLCNNGQQATEQERAALYEDFMSDKQHLLEHIFVSKLFQDGRPLYVGTTIWENAQYMVTLFIVWRYMMGTWLAGKGSTPTDIELIDFVALFGKIVLHGGKGAQVNLKLLELNEMQNLAHMMILING